MRPERPALFLPRRTSSRRRSSTVFWGDPLLQGVHIGLFAAVGALVVYSITLNRTTLGYEVRAVGHNPEAARYGGISVARNYFLAMAIAGLFAGLAGALDILGWQFRLDIDSDPGLDGRLHRHRRRASRPQHCRRRRTRRPAVRRTPDGDSVSQPRSCVLPARSRVESGDHHPGAHRSLRRAPTSSSCWRCDGSGGNGEERSPREAASARQASRRLDWCRRRGLRRPRRAAADSGPDARSRRSSLGCSRSRSASARGSGASAGSAATRSRPACSGS